jgi:dihydroxyacid dehydratase/phosphogluconate dehydratase
MAQASSGRNARLYLNITKKAKRTGGVAQVVKHLPTKHKALNSNTNTVERERQREKDREIERERET